LQRALQHGRLSSAHGALALTSLNCSRPTEVAVLTEVVVALTVLIGAIRGSFLGALLLVVLLNDALHVLDHVVNVVRDYFFNSIIASRFVLILRKHYYILLILFDNLLRSLDLLYWLRTG
jgi:hypothetical protein